MSAWIVYSKDGLAERCELHAVEYGGTHMGERAVTATFESNSKVDFDIFDYLSYRGEVFELESVPTVKKTSSFEYSYELRFVSRKYELERCEMRDLVPSDNGVVYPTPLSFSFTGDVRYLTDRIQACLDDLYGEGVWNIVIADGVESEEKNITIAQQNCWNALALVNSTYGLDFYIKGRVITIGGSQPVVSHVFEYGKGNGLYEIERAANTDTAIVTKLRAYGSDRNLDYSYPKKPEWSDSNLPVSFAFSPLRLMLPSFKVDKTDYVLADEETIKKYGIREASIVYEDIYPSITGATHNGQAIDEIKAVEEVDDNASTFVVHLHDLGFDLEEHLTTTDAQISMKSGAMQGYTFTISNIEKQEDNSYKITLGRVSAEGGENYNIPNSDWNMREGDKFVLLNILMPQKYIREAENRLKQRAEEYLAQYSKTNFGYNIGLHDKFLIENPSVYDALIEGSKLSVYDEELGISEDVTIQSITITENAADNTLPQVKVTLNNEPSASTLDRIQGKIDSLANESAANNFATQSEIMAQYRKKLDKPFFDKLFAAVDAEGNEIPSTDTVTPVAYIKARYDFAVVGGVTMYLNDGSLDLPNIFDGLPIDNDTIYWDGKVLKSRGAGEGGVTPTLLGDLTNVGAWANAIAIEDRIMVQKKDGSSWEALELSKIGGSASFENVKESGEGNAYTSFTLSEDGKSLTFVKGETFAKQSDYEALKNKVADFLEGSDTDSIINKWKELEAFLSGMKESDDLATILSTKWTKDDSKIANWDTAFLWGDHSKAGYFKSTDFTKSNIKSTLGISDWALSSVKPSYTTKEVAEDTNLYFTNQRAVSALTDTLKGYVTLSGTQTITGEKNFTGGLKVNGSPIVYNATGKYWKFEGDLLVTGGITMFGSDSSFSPSTITQAVNIDGSTLVRKNGVIMLNPDIQIGGGSDIDLSEYAKKATTLVGYGITDAYTKTEADNKYLLKTSYTASDVLAKLKTVDGANSGLDADKLDGQEGSYYASTASLSNYLPLSGGSMTGSIQLPNGTSKVSSIRWELGARINSDLSGHLYMISPSSIAMGAGYTGAGSSIHFQIASTGATGIAKSLLVGHDGYLTSDLYSLVVYGDSWYEKSLIVGENVRPRVTNTTNVGSTDYRLANVFTTKANVDGIEIKKSASGVLYIGGNLVVSGGITMYGTDGTTAPLIWDDAPIANTNGKKGVASYDPNFFAVNNGVVTFVGQTGGGGVTDYNDLTNKPDLSVYALKTSLSSYQTKITTTNKLDYGLISGTPTIPTNTNQLTNGAGFITSSGSITGNAATATALKNARTIWGNSFDGSANVSGNIALSTSKIFWHGDSNNYYISCPSDTGGVGLMYKAYSSHRFVAGGAERLTILSSGYVGVNKSNPTTTFHVKGTSTFDGDIKCVTGWTCAIGTKDIPFYKLYSNIVSGGNSLQLQFQLQDKAIAEFTTDSFLPKSSGISLGTSSYLWNGVYLGADTSMANNMKGVNFCDTSGYGVGKVGSSSAGMGVYTVGKLYLRGGCTKGTSGTITVSSTGATIDASGNMLVTGGVTMYSDLRKKTILNHVELSLKEVADAPLIEHYYNGDESKRTHVGSVAQYWAGLNDWFCKEDEEGFLTMEIQNAALASAISVARELTRYESKTDKQIKKLKKRIGELEEEIENLKKL